MINIGNIVTKQANLKANKLAVYDQPNDKRVSFSELNNMVNKYNIFPAKFRIAEIY